MDISEANRLKLIKDENRRLKRLVADLSLDNQVLKDLLIVDNRGPTTEPAMPYPTIMTS